MQTGDAYNRMAKWCAAQEHSVFEAKLKLIKLGIGGAELAAVIDKLKQENFLNEERFAIAFAGGKFRMKQWGRQKIRSELKKHQVSEAVISSVLAGLVSEDYDATMRKLVEKKIRSANKKDRRSLYYSVLRYAVGKGYESEKVAKELNRLIENIEYES
jgi:regulatory protein